MKLPDDMLPEEQDPQYEELITLLQQANLNPLLVDPTERAQVLSRARARLFQTDPEVPKPEDMPVLEVSELASFPSKPKALADKQHRDRRLIRLVSELAAMLVVLALIVSALLLFWPRLPSTGDHPTIAPPIGPLGKPITVHTQANGLEATMRVTSGPYFLSEMLQVDLSVTNHSHNTLLLERPQPEKLCVPFPSLLTVMMTGGGRPSDTDLQHNMADFGCGGELVPPVRFLPNQSFSFSKYFVLTNSGRITLTAQIGLAKQVPGQNNGYRSLPNSDPLAGHWPSLQIRVQAGIPSDRLITGQQRGARVAIDAPALVRSQLLYAERLRCDFSIGYSLSKLTTMTLQQPQCDNYTPNNHPNRFVKWTYAVGAPGYAVFSGSTQR